MLRACLHSGSNDTLGCNCAHAQVGLNARLVTLAGTISACCNGVHAATLTQMGGTELPHMEPPQQGQLQEAHSVSKHQPEGLECTFDLTLSVIWGLV